MPAYAAADFLLAGLMLVGAALYTSVGHAGASSYIALMALFGLSPAVMRPTALVLNILAAGFTSFRFVRAGLFSWRTLWPFLTGAAPMAFLGGAIQLPGQYYRPLVGVVLLLAAIRLLWPSRFRAFDEAREVPVAIGVMAGLCIGLLSGLTGTGGGIFLSPLLLLMALAIKLDSPGPVFFRQARVGRHGVEFRIHKFRTMLHSERGGSAGPQTAVAQLTVGADPRITRVGALLRRTRLDELAQLIDVLCGTMSLVGPRPEVPRYVATYPRDLRDKVLSVRPGITDPASLAFRDESAMLACAADPQREYVEIVLPAKLRLSARYIDEASFGTDLRLIVATLRALWVGQ